MDKTCMVFPFVSLVSFVVTSLALGPAPAHAQTTQKPPAEAGELNLTATSANVNESGSPVRIRILRWSTDEERNPVVAAMTPAAPAAAVPNPSAVTGDRGGTARGLPTGAAPNPAGGRGGGRGRAGRGGAARGGRGGAGAPPNPIEALTAAIGKARTLGYIWTNDVTGYAIKYAYHVALPDGGERIILATDRRLGAFTTAWRPVAATPLGAEALAEAALTDYEFTLIEIRLDSKGLGEGKTSLTTKAILDNEAKTVALDNYHAAPAIFQNVKR